LEPLAKIGFLIPIRWRFGKQYMVFGSLDVSNKHLRQSQLIFTDITAAPAQLVQPCSLCFAKFTRTQLYKVYFLTIPYYIDNINIVNADSSVVECMVLNQKF